MEHETINGIHEIFNYLKKKRTKIVINYTKNMKYALVFFCVYYLLIEGRINK
jgi:hypothetical protein